MTGSRGITFVFVDGVGITDDPRSALRALPLPTLSALTDDFSDRPVDRPGLAYRLLDATLGVEGLPQSATGQTTLLTGTNAAEALGRHQGPHPGARLQALLREQSLPVWARQQGLTALHANAYRPEYLTRAAASRRNMLSAFAFAARAAGQALMTPDDPLALQPGFWSDPDAAGRQLARGAKTRSLTIFEYWALDLSGHREAALVPARFAEVDAFLAGYRDVDDAPTLVVTSDHGNAEEPWHGHHTKNPVPLIVAGPLAGSVPAMRSLADVAGWMRGALAGGTERDGPRPSLT